MNIEEKAIEVLKHCKDRNFSAFDKIYFDDGTNMCIYQAIETLLTAYEKVKGENVKLRLQDIPLIEGELKAYKDRVSELKAELEKEKEKNKKAIDFINERKKTVNKDMAEGTRLQVGTFMWQVDELLEILKEE